MFFFFPDGIVPQGDVIVYQSDNENITTNVLFKDDTFWMSQKDIANLFNVGVPAISKHLNNIFRDGELNENSVLFEILYNIASMKIEYFTDA